MRCLTSLPSKLLLIGAGILASTLAFPAAPPANGAAIYKRRCATCHGDQGKGYSMIKTPDFTDPKWQASAKDKALAEVVKNGKKGTPMPAFGGELKDEEIRAVIAHIRSLDSSKKK